LPRDSKKLAVYFKIKKGTTRALFFEIRAAAGSAAFGANIYGILMGHLMGTFLINIGTNSSILRVARKLMRNICVFG